MNDFIHIKNRRKNILDTGAVLIQALVRISQSRTEIQFAFFQEYQAGSHNQNLSQRKTQISLSYLHNLITSELKHYYLSC